jgi:hypothetical protein
MQSILAKKHAPGATLLGLAGAALLLAGAQSAPGQGASPVGVWDVVQSGVRGGVASMTFSNDFTFSMDEIIVPNQPRSSIQNVGRGSEGIGRNPASSPGPNTNTLPAHTNLFGSEIFPFPNITNIFPQVLVQMTTNLDVVTVTNIPYDTTNVVFIGEPAGQWGFNTAGQLIGFFTEVSGVGAYFTNVVASITNDYGYFNNFIAVTNITVTNSVSSTNVVITNALVHLTNIVYTTNITADRFTNQISFTGKAVPGQRLTLNLQTPAGTVIARGIVPTPLASAAGQWYGRKQNQGLTFYEFFDVSLDDALRNRYFVEGTGPGYIFGGHMLISRQNRFAIAATVLAMGQDVTDTSSPFVVRAVTGPINISRRMFSGAKGIQGTDLSENLRFNYNGSRNP